MVKITEGNTEYKIRKNRQELEQLIIRNKILFSRCLDELDNIWNMTHYDIATSAYNSEMMALLMQNVYKNFFYVKRNLKQIQKRLNKDMHLRHHQYLKEMGEIDSEDEESF